MLKHLDDDEDMLLPILDDSYEHTRTNLRKKTTSSHIKPILVNVIENDSLTDDSEMILSLTITWPRSILYR